MKLLFASDLHGSAYYAEVLERLIETEAPDKTILLGDLLYHGPRNDLPRGYDTKRVTAILNRLKNKVLAVRGNCDAEVDQMVLDFPVLADYAVFPWNGKLIYATHGHVYGENNPPKLSQGDILLCGHTHIPANIAHDGFTYWNPGSVSIPKNGSARGYMLLTEKSVCWKDLEGNPLSGF